MGGETAAVGGASGACNGLSPRGRGNRQPGAGGICVLRSIPAWAGKPPRASAWSTSDKVYPRVGGETDEAAHDAENAAGLSPRGRGNRAVPDQIDFAYGSIPAWAGKPYAATPACPPLAVYPRVGGETVVLRKCLSTQDGLSPRGRGNRLQLCVALIADGSIPAWAGKPERTSSIERKVEVYPRVGGETGAIVGQIQSDQGLSPRGRGNRFFSCAFVSSFRSIPAWAGKPRSCVVGLHGDEVYPRVGGETRTGIATRDSCDGLSPRGRGNRDAGRHES